MLYCDIAVDGNTICAGVPCLLSELIKAYKHLDFSGDLTFFDSKGFTNPTWQGLGDRYSLIYFPADGSDNTTIPLEATPSQSVDVILAGQNCTISIYEKNADEWFYSNNGMNLDRLLADIKPISTADGGSVGSIKTDPYFTIFVQSYEDRPWRGQDPTYQTTEFFIPGYDQHDTSVYDVIITRYNGYNEDIKLYIPGANKDPDTWWSALLDVDIYEYDIGGSGVIEVPMPLDYAVMLYAGRKPWWDKLGYVYGPIVAVGSDGMVVCSNRWGIKPVYIHGGGG